MSDLEEITIVVKRSKKRRKSIGLEITDDYVVVVHVPFYTSKEEINKVLAEKRDWIYASIQKMKWKAKIRENEKPTPKLSVEELNALGDRALKVIPEKVRYYASVIGVTYGRITVRNQHTRWGSCSSKGNLNFNVLMMLMPEYVQDYIVVHELCHRKEMNHSKAFYEQVEKIIPDYKKAEKWIKEYGSDLMKRNL